MMKLNNTELIETTGGAISATMINALTRGFQTILDFGRTIGTAIHMIVFKKKC